ncbi:MAG TPA: ATP-binding protein [Candidatus Babeliales bacterium]|nr:ATP-binding protein [Candidatus Babeliales bacterium]
MKPLRIKIKKNFIGRIAELERLHAIGTAGNAAIIIMYGRRRIGKTELCEQAFRDRNLLKFEGIEGLSHKAQLAHAITQLAKYAESRLLTKTTVHNWKEFFELLYDYTRRGTWTIYLEELQWLARYDDTLIAELKYVWDNFFRHNPKLVIILCGSAPSFMIDHVVHSKALYNRSQYEMHLKEFNVYETKEFLKKRSNREVFDAYLTVGGVPEYLKWIGKESSVFISLCKHSFTSGSFFSREYERIFTSSMSNNKYYRAIIDILSTKKFATRTELAELLGVSSGGSLTNVLLDLEKSGFIAHYYPFNLEETTMLTRYAIDDNYMHFYGKFIKPLHKNIESGTYDNNPRAALKVDSYLKWLGFAFERFCRKYHHIIAKILYFSGVHYRSGVFFSRATDKENPGYQIDLIFDRADNVYTICEMKYLQGKVGTSVIAEFEKKLSLFPNKGNKTIHKVLICSEGAEDALIKRAYFDDIITCAQILDPRNW